MPSWSRHVQVITIFEGAWGPNQVDEVPLDLEPLVPVFERLGGLREIKAYPKLIEPSELAQLFERLPLLHSLRLHYPMTPQTFSSVSRNYFLVCFMSTHSYKHEKNEQAPMRRLRTLELRVRQIIKDKDASSKP